MNPIVSILCPTRKRTEKLGRMIASVFNTAYDGKSVEVCLRVHSDDSSTLKELQYLFAFYSPQIRVHIGPPLPFSEQRQAFNEALAIATAPLIWIMNDDCVIEGQGWDKQLADLGNAIAIPATHRLGKSNYVHDRHIPMFIMPIYPWKLSGFPPVHFDTGLWEYYEKAGTSVRCLEGITLWHDRDETDCKRIEHIT